MATDEGIGNAGLSIAFESFPNPVLRVVLMAREGCDSLRRGDAVRDGPFALRCRPRLGIGY